MRDYGRLIYSRLILGEEDSQTAPVCNGTVREMVAEIDRLKAELEASTDNYSFLCKEWVDSQKQLAEARSSGYWYERYKSCAEHLHLYTDGEEHGTADSCSFCTVVAEINGKLTEVQRQLAEARAENERLNSVDHYACALCPDVAQARREGWEQGKKQADSLLLDLVDVVLESKPVVQSARRAIAAMEYSPCK